jgi:hypothetical protein
MTAPLPPTAGPVSAEQRLAAEDHGVAPDIQAPLPDLAAMAADAESAGKSWCAGAEEWATSPQGAGEGGFTLGGATAGDWDSNVSFPHQGP